VRFVETLPTFAAAPPRSEPCLLTFLVPWTPAVEPAPTLARLTLTAHGSPRRFLAPQIGRNLRVKGEPSTATPIAFMALQEALIPRDRPFV
jgi:hypothetical protein